MNEIEEFNIQNIWITICQKKKIIIAIILISIFLGLIYSFFIVQPEYQSTGKILIEKADESVEKLFESNDIYKEILTNSNIQNMTIEEFRKNVISIEYTAKTRTIDINIKNTKKDDCYKIAKETCTIIVSKLEEFYKMADSKIIEQPIMPENPYNIDHLKDISIALGIGIILACFYVAFYSCYQDAIRYREEIENNTDMNVLGVIPEEKDKNENKTSYFIKNLRTNIELKKDHARPKSLLVTSFGQGEGKSYIVANLAISFAKAGKKVLLMDGDMIEGKQHNIFEVECKNGLSDLLSKIDDLDNVNIEEYIKKTNIENLSIMTLGNKVTNSSELLMSNKLNDVLQKLKERFDIIIMDSTPSLNISDAMILSSYAEATLIVIEYNKTKLEDLKKLETNIKNVGGKITGVVMNKLPIKHKECKILDQYSNQKIEQKQ